MAGAILHQRLFLGQAGLLTQAGQGVKLAQKADDRPAAAEGAHHGRGNVSHALLYGKALLLQRFAEQPGGIMLGKANLRVLPESVAHIKQQVTALPNVLQCLLLCALHRCSLLRSPGRRRVSRQPVSFMTMIWFIFGHLSEIFDFMIPPPVKVVNSFSLFFLILCRCTNSKMNFVCFCCFFIFFFSSLPLQSLELSAFPTAALVIPGQSRYTDR